MSDGPSPSTPPQDHSAKAWLKRFGIAGFLFFLVKGLVWLAVLGGAVKACS